MNHFFVRFSCLKLGQLDNQKLLLNFYIGMYYLYVVVRHQACMFVAVGYWNSL
jgi:hypothetical protein